jgi:mRNA interferase RelE/StbE
MNWTIIGFPSFVKDLESVPHGVRERVEAFVDETLPEVTNPFALGKLQKMKGERDFYKVRFGDYRLGLRVDQATRTIEVRRILHRREAYRHFP